MSEYTKGDKCEDGEVKNGNGDSANRPQPIKCRYNTLFRRHHSSGFDEEWCSECEGCSESPQGREEVPR